AESQAVSIQLQTVFPRNGHQLHSGQPGHSLSGQLQCHRALAPSWRGQAHWLRFRRHAVYELPLASACWRAMLLLSLAGAGKDTDSDPHGRHCWLRPAFARSPDTRVLLFSIAGGGSISRAVCQRSQVDPIFTSAPALPLPGRRICGSTNTEGRERKSPVPGPCGSCRRHFAWMAAPRIAVLGALLFVLPELNWWREAEYRTLLCNG